MNLSEQAFEFFRQLVSEHSGIQMTSRKRDVLAQRLEPLIGEMGLQAIEQLIELIELSGPRSSIYRQTVNALLTADGGLFRGYGAFRYMKHVGIPELLIRKSDTKKLNIWCIGCGRGEEAYSVAISLRNTVPELHTWDVDVLATDIANNNVERARTGLFHNKDIARGAPDELIEKNLTKFGHQWSVKKEHREWLRFETMNVLKPWPELPVFDVVLMRNVLLYLDPNGRSHVLTKLLDHVHDQTFIFLAPGEAPPKDNPLFMPVSDSRVSAYRMKPEFRSLPKESQVSELHANPVPETPSGKETRSGVNQLSPSPEDLATLRKLVGAIYLFRGMPLPVVEQVCERLVLYEFGDEEVLIKQGQKGKAFFILLDGEVEVFANRNIFRRGTSLATLGSGDIFGEMSLIMDQPCNASILAKGGCRAFVAGQKLFDYLVRENEAFAETIHDIVMERTADSAVKAHAKRLGNKANPPPAPKSEPEARREMPAVEDATDEPVEHLDPAATEFCFDQVVQLPFEGEAYAALSKLVRGIYLFNGLRAGEIDSVCQRIQLFGFPPNHTILKHGDDGSCFYIIYQGQVKVTSKNKFLKKGTELACLGPGDVFGEISLILDRPCGANVTTVESLKAFRVSHSLFDYLFDENATFAATVNAIALKRRADTAVKMQMS